MSRPLDAPLNDKSLNRILQIELQNSPVLQEARLAAERRERLIQEVEKYSGVRALREQLAHIEESPVLKHAREALSLFEESSSMRAVREQFRQLDQSSVLARAQMFEENSVITRALEAFKSQEELTRMAWGPMWELRRAGLFEENAPWRKTAELASQAIASFEGRFRLPDHSESALLAGQFQARAMAAELALSNAGVTAVALQQAMEKMTMPWLDRQEEMRSIAGFAEIQCIGEAVRSMPAFEDSLAATLRTSLGDWRDPISWRPEASDFEIARSVYVNVIRYRCVQSRD